MNRKVSLGSIEGYRSMERNIAPPSICHSNISFCLFKGAFLYDMFIKPEWDQVPKEWNELGIHRPEWEDTENINGGRWQVVLPAPKIFYTAGETVVFREQKRAKFRMNEHSEALDAPEVVDLIWREVCLNMVGNNISIDDGVNGATIQFKQERFKLSVWMDSVDHDKMLNVGMALCNILAKYWPYVIHECNCIKTVFDDTRLEWVRNMSPNSISLKFFLHNQKSNTSELTYQLRYGVPKENPETTNFGAIYTPNEWPPADASKSKCKNAENFTLGFNLIKSIEGTSTPLPCPIFFEKPKDNKPPTSGLLNTVGLGNRNRNY